jgi:hypothetical protein
MARAEVVVDRRRPGVQSELGQLLAQRDDLVLERVGRTVRDALGGPGPRLDRGVATCPEPADQLAHPALGHAVGTGNLPLAPPLHHDRVHHVASQIHRRPPSKVSTMLRHICPLSGELGHPWVHNQRRRWLESRRPDPSHTAAFVLGAMAWLKPPWSVADIGRHGTEDPHRRAEDPDRRGYRGHFGPDPRRGRLRAVLGAHRSRVWRLRPSANKRRSDLARCSTAGGWSVA